MKTYAIVKATGELVVVEMNGDLDESDVLEECPPWIYTQTPVRARTVYHQGGRTAAIKAHCIECSGGRLKIAKECTVSVCPLWCFRPGAKRGVKPPGVPSKAELNRVAEEGARRIKDVAALKKPKRVRETL